MIRYWVDFFCDAKQIDVAQVELLTRWNTSNVLGREPDGTVGSQFDAGQ